MTRTRNSGKNRIGTFGISATKRLQKSHHLPFYFCAPQQRFRCLWRQDSQRLRIVRAIDPTPPPPPARPCPDCPFRYVPGCDAHGRNARDRAHARTPGSPGQQQGHSPPPPPPGQGHARAYLLRPHTRSTPGSRPGRAVRNSRAALARRPSAARPSCTNPPSRNCHIRNRRYHTTCLRTRDPPCRYMCRSKLCEHPVPEWAGTVAVRATRERQAGAGSVLISQM